MKKFTEILKIVWMFTWCILEPVLVYAAIIGIAILLQPLIHKLIMMI